MNENELNMNNENDLNINDNDIKIISQGEWLFEFQEESNAN